jgi:hypothetical protein
MKFRDINFLILILLINLPLLAQVNDNTVLKGVNIIDGRNNFLNNMDIRIEGSKIISINKSRQAAYADSVNVLDLTDKYVIPGLMDSHVHLGQLDVVKSPDLTRKELRRKLFSGITTVREMSGDARLIAYEKRLIAINQIPGPDIYYSTNYGGPDMVQKDMRIKRASMGVGIEDAAWFQEANENMNFPLSIAMAKGTGSQGIKMYAGIDAEVMKRLSDEAHKQGLKSWSHFTVFPDRPIEVVKAGVDVVSHVWGVFWQDPDVDPSLRIPFTHTSFKDARHAVFPPDLSVLNADDNEIELLFDEMVKREVIWDVTYGVPNPKIRNLFKTYLVKANKKGVKMCTGTDWHNDISEPFPSLFDEIEALVDDGILSNEQAIEASTFNGALAIGIEATHGSIEEGKVANMVVLDNNPIENIEALKSIVLTIKNGIVYRRKDFR